ncbi:hypothetical protein DERP_014530 [Dermatophagoides pteronyssinus]|uniref:Uncharacterized protein n=1 Tax=Dermatophagoides pteronyssinus TaxID=6956 RepID=A0ABQ8JTL8_DERPT|nr:hypothetical protein DERP_014530 [Dermatophagoides pteronyssinus]
MNYKRFEQINRLIDRFIDLYFNNDDNCRHQMNECFERFSKRSKPFRLFQPILDSSKSYLFLPSKPAIILNHYHNDDDDQVALIQSIKSNQTR